MVMNAAEAESLIEAPPHRKAAGGGLPGGLPQICAAVKMLRAGELGNCSTSTASSGRTGTPGPPTPGGSSRKWQAAVSCRYRAHAQHHLRSGRRGLAEVTAWLDNRGRPVDIRGVVMGRLASGVMVTINACGDAIPGCESEILVFCTQAIVRTGQWGERLDIRRAGRKRFSKVDLPPMRGAWEQFILVRNGEIPNPCPPEVGLRMARLWDAIRASAAQQGTPVRLNSAKEYA
jgi:predicted dehydrogenase